MKNNRTIKRAFLRSGAIFLTLAAGAAISYGAPQAATTSGTTSPGPSAAKDPGVRGGTPAAGGPLRNLTIQQLLLFSSSQATFREVDSVFGTIPGEPGSGLGPSFNLNSCAGCHAYPAVGGASPQLNPQVAMAVMHGANNRVPSFISAAGPIREARFKTNPDGTPDGGVHDLFVITGRSDAPSGCRMAQTEFATRVDAALQHELQDDRATVALQFEHVFAGVRMRRREVERDAAVERAAAGVEKRHIARVTRRERLAG